MRPRRKSALLWGAVGALAFLALHQAYLLADGAFLGVGPVAALTVVVFAGTALSAYYAEGRFGMALQRRERHPEDDTE
jgi:hypothetical protein